METSFEDVMRVLTTVSALYMCASPSSAVYRIIKHRNVGSESILPFATLWVSNHIWMLYGHVTNNMFPIFLTYAIGDALSIIFLAVYLCYATDRKAVFKTCLIALVCNAAVSLYVILGMNGVFNQNVTPVVGITAVTSSLLMYASPFAAIRVVLQTRSSVSMPFAMILAGVINNLLWIVYGFLVFDLIVVIPSSVNMFLGIIQVALYGLFHPSRCTTGGDDALCHLPKDQRSELTYTVMESDTPGQAKETADCCTIAIEESASIN